MILDDLAAKVKGKKIKLVFTEGEDYRIQEAVMHLVQDDICAPILLGNKAAIAEIEKKYNFDLKGCDIIDPDEYKGFENMVAQFMEIRKGKTTEENARKLLHQTNYFGTMLVKLGFADGLLGGATYSTADTVRPALQVIRTKPGEKLVSSCFLLIKGDEQLVFGDCGININPTAAQLVDITIQTARSTKNFGKDPVVALLSYSTNGSAKGDDVTKMQECLAKLKEMPLDFPVDGEMQFDCAVNEDVAKKKFPGSPVAGHANTFIFPNISAGNIAYKVAARLGGYTAMGPLLQGINAPINDLSRGCTWEEVYNNAIITAHEKLVG